MPVAPLSTHVSCARVDLREREEEVTLAEQVDVAREEGAALLVSAAQLARKAKPDEGAGTSEAGALPSLATPALLS